MNKWTKKKAAIAAAIVLLLFALAALTEKDEQKESNAQNKAKTNTESVSIANAAAVKKDKEFPYTRRDIIKAYDDVMQQVGNVRPLEAAKEEMTNAKYHDSYFYMLTPNVGIMQFCNSGGINPFQVKAIGIEDGTQETRALIVLNAMTLMAAVTPGWKGDERGAVAKELGITTDFPPRGDGKSLSYGGRDFQFANNGEQGLTLTISPSAPK